MLEHAPQRRARIAAERAVVGLAHVAEHPRDDRVRPPRQDLERARVGVGDDVVLAQPRGALQRRAVQADALLQRRLELGDGDRDALEQAEHVDEPEADELHAPFLDRAQHEFFPG